MTIFKTGDKCPVSGRYKQVETGIDDPILLFSLSRNANFLVTILLQTVTFI